LRTAKASCTGLAIQIQQPSWESILCDGKEIVFTVLLKKEKEKEKEKGFKFISQGNYEVKLTILTKGFTFAFPTTVSNNG
jgi:hypothetical protein